MLLFYIRHGDPIYDPDSLTPLGRSQADALAKRLAVYGIDRIFSSPSERAYLTALPTAQLTKKEITKIDFFHEDNAWRYFTVPVGENRRGWVECEQEYRKMFVSHEVSALGDKWYEYSAFDKFNFGEGVEFFNEKIDNFMITLGYAHDRDTKTYKALQKNSDRVAIFAHGGVGGVFLSSVLDIPYPQFISRHALSHTGMTVIEFADEGDGIIPTVLQFNSDSHLYREGLPTYHCNKTPI